MHTPNWFLTSSTKQGEQRETPPGNDPLGDPHRPHLPPLLRRLPAARPLQRNPHPPRRAQVRGAPGLRADARPDLRGLRRGHDPLLRPDGLGHAQGRARAHGRPPQSRRPGRPAGPGPDPLCQESDRPGLLGEWVQGVAGRGGGGGQGSGADLAAGAAQEVVAVRCGRGGQVSAEVAAEGGDYRRGGEPALGTAAAN